MMSGMYVAEINRLREENEKLKKEVIFFMKEARKAELRVKELEETEQNLLEKLKCVNS